MPYDDQLDIREMKPGVWKLEFPYDADFIESLKAHVPIKDRQYDDLTHIWTVKGDAYLPRIIASAERRFQHITKIFERDGGLVYQNVRTGTENVQKGLF